MMRYLVGETTDVFLKFFREDRINDALLYREIFIK